MLLKATCCANSYSSANYFSISTGLSLDRMSTTKISVAGKVNSQDLTSLAADVIYSSEPRRVVGTKRVRSLRVLKDVDAASINGGQLVGMYLSSGSDQPVHAPVHFSTLVTKDLSLRAGSLFNGVTSEDVFLDGAKHVNSYNGNATIARPLRLGALRAKTVNGQDWLRLTLSLASVHESNSFQLPVTFQRPLEVGYILTRFCFFVFFFHNLLVGFYRLRDP